jgi:outer membrane cobalamin receptor
MSPGETNARRSSPLDRPGGHGADRSPPTPTLPLQGGGGRTLSPPGPPPGPPGRSSVVAILLLPLLSLLASFPALAEPVDADPKLDGVYDLPAVTVRAERSDERLRSDRAAAGTVLDADDLDDAGVTLPEVLDQQVGVRTTRVGGPAAFTSLSIRGSTPEQVLVVLDGVPLNAAIGGPVDLSRLPVGNLARVEIVRGAAPIRFGPSAIGGVVAVETRGGEERELSAALGVGSWWRRQARVYVAEPLRRGSLSLGVDYDGQEGGFPYWNDGGTRYEPGDDHATRRANNRSDQLNLLARARLRLSERWDLSMMDWLFWRDQGLPGLGLYDTSRSELDRLDNLLVISGAGRGLASERLDVEAQLSMLVARTRMADPLGEIGLGRDEVSDLCLTPFARAYVHYALTDWWDWTAAASSRLERFEPSDAGLAGEPSSRLTTTLGVESGLRVRPIRLLLLPSGRVEWARHALHPRQTGPTELAARDGEHVEGSARLALVQEPVAGTRLTMSGGRAVRLPSLFELFGNTGGVLGNPALAPEIAWSVEGGVIHAARWLPRWARLRLEVHAFWSRVDDRIGYVQNAQNVSVAVNTDRARVYGLESAARLDLFGHLRLDGNHTLSRTRNESAALARHGKILPLRPASEWHLRAEGYLRRVAWLREAAVYGDLDWAAGNFLDEANLVTVPARLYLGAGASVTLRPWRLRLALAVRNLLDEANQDLVGHPLPGRSVFLTLSGRAW